MSGAPAQRLFRAAEIQGVLDPLAPFFHHFLGRAKKWHKPRTERAQLCEAVEEVVKKSYAPQVVNIP